MPLFWDAQIIFPSDLMSNDVKEEKSLENLMILLVTGNFLSAAPFFFLPLGLGSLNSITVKQPL